MFAKRTRNSRNSPSICELTGNGAGGSCGGLPFKAARPGTARPGLIWQSGSYDAARLVVESLRRPAVDPDFPMTGSAAPGRGPAGHGPVGPVGFDLDLTLIDSRPAILAAWTEVARETGVAIDLAAIDRRMGAKLEDEAAFWFPADEVAPAAATYRRHYVRLAPSMTAALPGALESVAAVRAAGAAAVVITAKHPVSVGPSMLAAGLTVQEIFTLVYGPEKAAVLTKIHAVAYVGDTPADMMAARSAGTYAVGVPTGSFARTELLTAGAHIVLDSLREFPAWYAAFRDPG